jgi:hypothetical protein
VQRKQSTMSRGSRREAAAITLLIARSKEGSRTGHEAAFWPARLNKDANSVLVTRIRSDLFAGDLPL